MNKFNVFHVSCVMSLINFLNERILFCIMYESCLQYMQFVSTRQSCKFKLLSFTNFQIKQREAAEGTIVFSCYKTTFFWLKKKRVKE